MTVCQKVKKSSWRTWKFKPSWITLTAFFTTLILILSITTPGWSGFACVENPCFHGICIDYLDTNSTHQCYCISGFTGYSCQINWDECKINPCLNGGVCSDGIDSFNCSCPENFAGTFCQYDMSACEELFPCQNNGTCTIDPNSLNGTFMCDCEPGFSGPQCEIDISVCNVTENVCLNGGKCVDGLGISFHCQCQEGWTGKTCEIDVDECQSQPCLNSGICINKINDFSCACPFGYTGKACESKLRICEENPCKNSAFCLHEDEDDSKFTCYCFPDYHGSLCEFKYNDCDPPPKCNNGGTCIDGVGEFSCSCSPDFFGPTCQCTIANLTDPECHYNETLLPSIIETPLYPSVSITEIPTMKASDLIYIFSTTPFRSSLFSTYSIQPSPEQTAGIISDVYPTQSQSQVEFPPESTIILSNLSPFPSEIISLQDSSLKPFPPSMSTTILQSPGKTIEIIATPSESEMIYDPCPTISIDGTQEILVPSSMSLSPFPNRITTVEGELLSSSPVIYMSDEFISLGISASVIKPEPSSEILMTITTTNGPVEVSKSVVYPPEQDLVSGISLESNIAQIISSSLVESLNLIVTTSTQITPRLPEATESFEFSTVELQTGLPFYSSTEMSIAPSPPTPTFHLLSPIITSAFSMLSPKEPFSMISPSSIIFDGDENGITSTPLLQSELIATVKPFSSEEILNASIRSDDIAFPPLIKTTVIDLVSSLSSGEFIRTTSLLLPHTLIKETTVFVAPSTSLFNQEFISISLNPSTSSLLQSITPEPSITLVVKPTTTTTPSSSSESDLCLNYCQNNAKCISTSIQPVCICPFKFIGERCETQRKKFTTTSLTGDSFLGYKVPNESINRINVVTKMATNAPEGILFYTSVGKLYALIFTQGGHVTLHFSCGAQSMHFVETRTRVDNGYNFTLDFKMEMLVHGVNELHCVSQVSVNDSYIMRGEQIVGHNGHYENFTQLIYIGGVGTINAHQKNDELIGILPGFRGCLYSLKINQEEKDLFDDAIDGKEVTECSAFGCVTSPCFGLSKCIPSNKFPFWHCICSPGFQGTRCQIRLCDSNPCLNGATCAFPSAFLSDTNYNNVTLVNENSTELTSFTPICLCPMGLSGSRCEKKINTTKPSFRPILGFDYSAFIAYEPIPRFVDWVQMKFHFVPRNISQIALLVYSGYNHGISSVPPSDQLENIADLVKDGSAYSLDENNNLGSQKISDFFAITYVHGYVTLTWNLGSGTQRIITPSPIDKRLNVHTLFAGRSGRQGWLKVDGMTNVTGKSPGPFHRLNVNTELFVGGYESFRFEGLPLDLPLHKGFDGCIFDFGFRVKNRLYLPQALRGRNIKSCYEEDC